MGMVDESPNNYALLMGYANILNNRGLFDEAIEYYEKIFKMKPNWAKPLECLAHIY